MGAVKVNTPTRLFGMEVIDLVSSDDEGVPAAEAVDLVSDEQAEDVDSPLVLVSSDEGALAAAAKSSATSTQSVQLKKAAKRSRKRGRRGSWRRSQPTSAIAAAPPSAEEAQEVAALAANTGLADLRQEMRLHGLQPGSRTKAGVALRLVRARRAAQAVESIYDGQAASRPPRFDSERAGHVRGSLEACRLCACAIPAPRRTFCTDECVHFHLLRTSASYIRRALRVRDDRKCALCGVDVAAAYNAASAAVREALSGGSQPAAALSMSVADGPFATHATLSANRRGRPKVKEGSFWQADHVVAVSDGGGSCSLANLRTLCTPCHAATTAAQASHRASERRKSRKVAGAPGSLATNDGMGVESADGGRRVGSASDEGSDDGSSSDSGSSDREA